MDEHAGHDHSHEGHAHPHDNAVAHTGKPTDRERVLGAIAYIGPLFIVSYLMAEHSKFVKYHASQGLAFFLAVLILRIVLGGIMAMVFIPSTVVSYRTGMMGMMYGGAGIVGFVMMLVSLAILIVGIIAIVKAAQGEEWEMPVVGALAKKMKL